MLAGNPAVGSWFCSICRPKVQQVFVPGFPWCLGVSNLSNGWSPDRPQLHLFSVFPGYHSFRACRFLSLSVPSSFCCCCFLLMRDWCGLICSDASMIRWLKTSNSWPPNLLRISTNRLASKTGWVVMLRNRFDRSARNRHKSHFIPQNTSVNPVFGCISAGLSWFFLVKKCPFHLDSLSFTGWLCSGLSRELAKVTLVNVFLYHFYGTPVVKTKLVLNNQGRYHRTDGYTYTTNPRIEHRTRNARKRIPGN